MQVCAFSKAPLPGESGSPPGYITHPPTIPQPTGAGHYRSPASVPSLVGVSIGSGRAGHVAHSSTTHAAATLRASATPLRSGQRHNPSRFLYPPVAPLRGARKAVGWRMVRTSPFNPPRSASRHWAPSLRAAPQPPPPFFTPPTAPLRGAVSWK